MSNSKQNRSLIIRYFNALSGVIKTPELCKQFTNDLHLIEHIIFFDGAFPKYELFVDEMIAEEDKVLVRARLIGVHKGEFDGIPPTGRTIKLPFAIRYTIKDGMIVDHWLIADQVILMEQLGVMDNKDENRAI